MSAELQCTTESTTSRIRSGIYLLQKKILYFVRYRNYGRNVTIPDVKVEANTGSHSYTCAGVNVR